MPSLWPRSGTIERLGDDVRAVGAKAYFFQGGTTTPLTVYQDSGENAAHMHPVVADANGRWPDIFVPYIVSYDVRVTSAEGVQLTFTLEIPNPDPVELSVVVDPTNTVQTGMVHGELVNTTKAGFVRLNGRTIGNAASGATERAHADTSALFTYLWNGLIDTIAPVSGGRGGSAASDYAANKTIVLPSMQGAVFVGLDDMGATVAGKFAGLTFLAGDAVTAGSYIGANSVSISLTQLPAHSHSGTTATSGAHVHTASTSTHSHTASSDGAGIHTHGVSDPGHIHDYTRGDPTGSAQVGGLNFTVVQTSVGTSSSTTGISLAADGFHTHSVTVNAVGDIGVTVASGGSHTHTFTTDSQGGGQPLNNLPVSRLVTWFIKL